MKNHVEALKNLFADKKLGGFIITNDSNLLYFTGFEGGLRLLVARDTESILYVPGTNYEAAKEQAKNCKVELFKRGENLNKKIAKEVKSLKLKSIGFDALDVSVYMKLKEALGTTELNSQNGLVLGLRKVKDETELDCIRKAAEMTSEGIEVASELIRPGMREFEVAAEIEYAMRKMGSDGVAFDTIIASGVHSAFPHGGCTDKKIQKGDLAVVDIGAKYKYYRADLTRTFVAGKPSSKQEKLYKIVKDAQESALQIVKAGTKCADVDSVARKNIEKEGYGEQFVHGLGHGIGLDVHEVPTLNPESKDVLDAGTVFTIEPGIYVIGFGGVRVEDTVLAGKSRGERLTKGTYTLEVE